MRRGSATIGPAEVRCASSAAAAGPHPSEGESMRKLVIALALACSCAAATAATYPAKPVTAIVPFPPGGSTDMLARIVGPSVNQRLGQPFVIDNRPGATGAIGATMVKRAPADGHTILVASIGVWAINPFLQKGLQYDPSKDFDLLTV